MTPAASKTPDKLALLLRVVIFAAIALAGYMVFPVVMFPIAGYLVTGALSTFAAASAANAFSIRIWERGQLADIGLGWTRASRRNLLLGTLGGVGAACAVLVPPLLVRAATFEPAPTPEHRWPSFLFVSVVLVFGAVGEEMFFHGYGFQVLLRVLGTFATILPTGLLFGLLHLWNPKMSTLAFINTVAWGVLLGWAYVRSGDLWLPIGLHFGWNWTLPLFGVNLSGFTIGTTGYALRWNVGAIWSGGEYGPEGGLLTLAAVVGLFFYLWRAPIQTQASAWQ